MSLIIHEESRTTGIESPSIADCSPTASRYGKPPVQRKPEPVDPVDAVVEFILAAGPHSARMVRGEALCLTCRSEWPCQPTRDVLFGAAASARQLVEDFKTSHDGASPGDCGDQAEHDSHRHSRDGVALFCLGA